VPPSAVLGLVLQAGPAGRPLLLSHPHRDSPDSVRLARLRRGARGLRPRRWTSWARWWRTWRRACPTAWCCSSRRTRTSSACGPAGAPRMPPPASPPASACVSAAMCRLCGLTGARIDLSRAARRGGGRGGARVRGGHCGRHRPRAPRELVRERELEQEKC
jgi:hypothetical protein